MTTPNHQFEAVPPFTRGDYGYWLDATGDLVLVCSNDGDCQKRYAEDKVDSDPHFICPECGRLGQRMEEYQPKTGEHNQ